MKKLALLALAFCFGLSLAVAQEQEAPSQEEQAAMMEEMMKKFQELATPGEAHKRLDVMVGSWDVESRMWMGGEGSGEAQTSKGTAEYKWILGGKYLRQDYKGEMMGVPFTGIGITGYDNYAKKYVGMWIDDMSTMISTMHGSAGRTGDVFVMYGPMHEWSTGELDKVVKYVFRIINKDKHVFEIHDEWIVDNTKVMELTYTRKK
jgi:hypothetical protein